MVVALRRVWVVQIDSIEGSLLPVIFQVVLSIRKESAKKTDNPTSSFFLNLRTRRDLCNQGCSTVSVINTHLAVCCSACFFPEQHVVVKQ